jgi:glycosyltransferase involved in cell wall biosynthesis
VASFLVDGIICVSQELKGRLYCRKQDIAIIPSSTDTELFRPLDQTECRSRLGWASDKAIAVFFGGTNPRVKRLDTALIVKQALCSHNTSIELRIVREVIPHGDMPVYLNAADCLVLLSSFEGSPNLVREACACNTPVVTVPVGDVCEVLRDVVPSQIVDRNIDEIAAAVARVAALKTRSNGRERMKRFSNEITAMRTTKFYTRIVAKYIQKYVIGAT